MDPTYQVLHDQLQIFLQEALLISKDSVKEPRGFSKYFDVESKEGREQIVPKLERNWKNLDVIGDENKIRNLKSYFEVYKICQNIPHISKHDNKAVYAFSIGYPFAIADIPIYFLQALIFLERGYSFQQNRFENIFSDFLTFISDDHYSNATVLVPLMGIEFSENHIEVDEKVSIKKLNPYQVSEFLNHHVHRDSKYLRSPDVWQKIFFEFQIKIEWLWPEKLLCEEYDEQEFDKHLHSQDFSNYIRDKVNQEIIILRSLSNSSVSAYPFEIMYTGWFSPKIGGGGIISPWNIPQELVILSAENLEAYKKNRNRFLKIGDKKTKEQIFVAMRKLAMSMDKNYIGDQVLDVVSGLERLLVNEEKSVKQKCSKRTAILLEGDDTKKRNQLQSDIREAYRFRSEVAHGYSVIEDEDAIISKRFSGERDEAKKDYREIIQNRNIRNVARDALCRAIIVCIQKQTTNFDWGGH